MLQTELIHSRLDWEKWGDAAIVFVASVGGAVLIAMGFTNEIGVAYGGKEKFLTCLMSGP